jgi:hypothetical protein
MGQARQLPMEDCMSRSPRSLPRLTLVLMALFVATSGAMTLLHPGGCARPGTTFLVATPNVCRRLPSLSVVDPSAHPHLARSRALAFRRRGIH